MHTIKCHVWHSRLSFSAVSYWKREKQAKQWSVVQRLDRFRPALPFGLIPVENNKLYSKKTLQNCTRTTLLSLDMKTISYHYFPQSFSLVFFFVCHRTLDLFFSICYGKCFRIFGKGCELLYCEFVRNFLLFFPHEIFSLSIEKCLHSQPFLFCFCFPGL